MLTLSAQVTIYPDTHVGPIKKMNAVNNGPEKPNPNSSTTNFPSYKAAEFPYARLHDAPINWNWAHTVDMLITNFTNDKNMVKDRKIEVEIKGIGTREVMTYITDRYHLYTQVPVEFVDDKASLWFTPNSLIYIELN